MVKLREVLNITLLHLTGKFLLEILRKNTHQIRKIIGWFKVAALTKNNRKIPEIIRDVFRTHQTSKMELFANIVDCIQPLTILQNTPYDVFYRVNVPLIKLSKNLVHCHVFHKNLGLQSLQISSTFKFNFIFTLLPYGETLSVANGIHVSGASIKLFSE